MFYRQRRRIPIYDSFYLDIVVSDDINKLNRIIREYDNKDEYYAQVNRTSFKNKESGENYLKSVTVILNPYNKGNLITNKVIVHETIHVKNIVLEALYYKQKANNDEAEAYFTEWVYGEIEEFFNKVMKKENESNKEAAGTE